VFVEGVGYSFGHCLRAGHGDVIGRLEDRRFAGDVHGSAGDERRFVGRFVGQLRESKIEISLIIIFAPGFDAVEQIA